MPSAYFSATVKLDGAKVCAQSFVIVKCPGCVSVFGMRLLALLLATISSAAAAQPFNAVEAYQRGRQQQLVEQCVQACGRDGNCQARCLSASPPPPPPQAQPQRRQPVNCFTDRSGYTFCQ